MTNLLPPQNLEAEEAILGGILLDTAALDRILTELHPDAFYVPAHRQIYQAALNLKEKGSPTDLMTLTTWLTDQGILEKVGGISKLAQLVDRTVSAVNIDKYAELVMDKYLRRRLGSAGREIQGLADKTTEELDVVLDQSEQALFNVCQQKRRSSTRPNSEVAIESFRDLETASPIYPTGLYDLDELLVGFEPGTLTVLAGRPSMGKTHISLFLTQQFLSHYKLPVVFFSLEMTAKQLEYRLWSLLSVVSSVPHLIPLAGDRVRRHRAGKESLTKRELDTIALVMGMATELPLYLNDDRGITVTGITSECRRLIGEQGQLGLVVVDYLQMMASESGGNRSYELGDVARGLYRMAGDLNVPVLALSQISRAVESRSDKRPTMADLSQSGILEMVADNVILVYRDEYYNPDTSNRETIELIVAKARHGLTGVAKFLFDKSYGLLKSLG